MKVYTYSDARQNLATLLEEAKRDGMVRIQRRDGQSFLITPETDKKSPLDVEGVDTDISLDEMLAFIKEGRRAFSDESL